MILPAPTRAAIFSITPCFASHGTPGLVKKFRNSLDVPKAAAKSPNCFSAESAAPCASATSASAFAYWRLADFNSASLRGFSQNYPSAIPAQPASVAWQEESPRRQRQALRRALSVPAAQRVLPLRFLLEPRCQLFSRRFARERGCVRLPRQLRVLQWPAARRFPASDSPACSPLREPIAPPLLSRQSLWLSR